MQKSDSKKNETESAVNEELFEFRWDVITENFST